MKKQVIALTVLIVSCLISGCINQSYTNSEDGLPEYDYSKDRKESKNAYIATRIPLKTDAQVDFVNSHYDYAMTSVLSTELREKVQGPRLFLYRSIQGT